MIVHELTALPDRIDFRREETYAATNRVRTEGTRNLIDAARAAGARRIVCQSIAFAYRMDGEGLKTEDDPLLSEAAGAFGSGVSALREMEEMVLGTTGWTDSCSVTASSTARAPTTRRRAPRHIGRPAAPPAGRWQGQRRVLVRPRGRRRRRHGRGRGARRPRRLQRDRRRPGTDDEWVPVFAQAAGAKPPRRVPVWLARFVAGKDVSNFAVELRGASNEKAKRELGWEPAHPSWRSGFAESLAHRIRPEGP